MIRHRYRYLDKTLQKKTANAVQCQSFLSGQVRSSNVSNLLGSLFEAVLYVFSSMYLSFGG